MPPTRKKDPSIRLVEECRNHKQGLYEILLYLRRGHERLVAAIAAEREALYRTPIAERDTALYDRLVAQKYGIEYAILAYHNALRAFNNRSEHSPFKKEEFF